MQLAVLFQIIKANMGFKKEAEKFNLCLKTPIGEQINFKSWDERHFV